jgi:2Fe-2S ferredoxin
MKKVKIHFVLTDNKIETVEAPVHATVMEASKYHSLNKYIPGIDGECSGACACATCHIKIDKKWIKKVGKPPKNTPEQDLLDYDYKSDDNSRLGCQIELTEELDGLVVHIPK